MQYTLVLEPALSIVSGMNAPCLFFRNTSASGTIIINSITGYAIDAHCELIMRANAPASGSITGFNHYRIISGIAPNDSDVPMAISGFLALAWDGLPNTATRGISGITFNGGQLISASYIKESPGPAHFNGRYNLRSGDNFALWAKSVSTTPSKLFIDVELAFDLGGLMPVTSTISQDPFAENVPQPPI